MWRDENILQLHKETEHVRGKWRHGREFILSNLGFAIGLGVVTRFPYVCYKNGGGAFVLACIVFYILFGIPLYFLEVALGQFSNLSVSQIFQMCPLLKGTAYSVIVMALIADISYNVQISYSIVYLYYSFQSKIPWSDCNNSWNTKYCVNLTGLFNNNDTNNDLAINVTWKTPADEFFHNEILKISSGIDDFGEIIPSLVIASIITYVTLIACTMNGVRSIGKVVYVTAIVPFILLFILLIRGVTLPGAWKGIKIFIYPEWKTLLNLENWTNAATQVFFSLGPGWGGLINMASYNKFNRNIKRDSIILPMVSLATSLCSGFVVFSVLGYLSHQTGLPVSKVATEGIGLAFITYPEAISMLPWPQFWAALFFIMLYFLGLDSAFVQVETIVSSIMDDFPVLRSKQKTIYCILGLFLFLASLPCLTKSGMYIIQLLDWYTVPYSVLIICLIELLMVCWIYGVNSFVRDIEFMINKKLNILWSICWKYLVPLILMFLLIVTIMNGAPSSYNNVQYPNWTSILGYMCSLASIICIPIYACYILSTIPGHFLKSLKISMTTSENWGPASNEDRTMWEFYKKRRYSYIDLQKM